MPSFTSYDGTLLAYRLAGTGPLLVCIPGGPGRASEYLGNLGGLDSHRTLVLLDNRGSGRSGDSADPSDVDSYRADRLVHDVEALRAHLGLEVMDLWGHSGGAHIAALYATAHPQRLSSLSLICGGQRVAGVAADDGFLPAIDARAGQAWYPQARKALEQRIAEGPTTSSPELKLATAPFFYGRWDEASAAHAASDALQRRNPLAQKHFPYDPDPDAARAALSRVTAPTLAYAGALDPSPRPDEAERLAAVFPNGRTVIQPDAGHYPWLDNPTFFVQAVLEPSAESRLDL